MKALATVQIDNDEVMVTEWRFQCGEETGYHVHAHNYVVVPLTSGTLRVQEENQVREIQLDIGASYASV